MSDIFPIKWCEDMLQKIQALGPKERLLKEMVLWIVSQLGNASLVKQKEKEGIEFGLDYQGHDRIGIIWPSVSRKTGTLKKHDHFWSLIMDFKSSEPFFFIPIRRPRKVKYRRRFLKRILLQVEVLVAVIDHWPTCPICNHELTIERKRKFVETDESGIPLESEHMRWLVCPYRSDGNHEESVSVRIVDIPGLSSRLQKAFRLPFERNKNYVGRYFKKYNRYPNSARMMRAANKFGFEVPKKISDFNDLQYAGMPEFNDTPHPE